MTFITRTVKYLQDFMYAPSTVRIANMKGMGVIMKMILINFIREWHTKNLEFSFRSIVAGEIVKIFEDNRAQKRVSQFKNATQFKWESN